MQKGCVCAFMWGELTNRDTMKRLEETLENQEQEQFEVLLYRKNSKLRSLLFLRSDFVLIVVCELEYNLFCLQWAFDLFSSVL